MNSGHVNRVRYKDSLCGFFMRSNTALSDDDGFSVDWPSCVKMVFNMFSPISMRLKPGLAILYFREKIATEFTEHPCFYRVSKSPHNFL